MSHNTPIKNSEALKYVEKRLGFPLKTLCRFPKFFLIETINFCNARCLMCGIDFDSKKKAVMSDELYNKICDEIIEHKNHVEKVLLYLDCEPLLDKKLALRIKRMKEGGVKTIQIATNASILDEDRAGELIDAGMDEVYITVDSLKKETFETIKPGLKFESVYENTFNLIKLRNKLKSDLIIRVQMVMQELNSDESDSFTKHWSALLNSNDKVVVTKAHNWGSTVKTMEFGDENEVNNIPCIALWGTLAIHVDGKVGLCCMDTNTTVPLGNLNLQTIAEIWNGEPMKKIRQKHISAKRSEIPICDGCTLWRDTKHNKEEVLKV